MSDKPRWWEGIGKDFDRSTTAEEPERSESLSQDVERHEPFPDRYPAPGGDWQSMADEVITSHLNQQHERLLEQSKEEIRQPDRNPVDLSKDTDHER